MTTGAPPERTGRPNRVAPDGTLFATQARGTFFGNRGPLLDASARLARSHQGRRWIVCRLDFKGRRRTQWQPGSYTELYFLDEATAFAAGHRPCAECRRPAYDAYQTAWQRAFGGERPDADTIDRRLHAERVGPRGAGRPLHHAPLADLPDGVIVQVDGADLLVWQGALRTWTPAGYDGWRALPAAARAADDVVVRTPAATVAVLRAGYTPLVHASAG